MAIITLYRMKKNKLILVFLPGLILMAFMVFVSGQPALAGLWGMQQETLSGIDQTFDVTGEVNDPGKIVIRVIKVFLGFVGLIAVIILIWGGFRWMNAGGNDENVRQAKKTVVRTLIGLAIIIASYAITEFTVFFIEDAFDDWGDF